VAIYADWPIRPLRPSKVVPMANFFIPSYDSDTAHAEDAAGDAGISELIIEKNKAARFAVWGGGPDGKPLAIKIYRNGSVVSEGNTAPVKLMRGSILPSAHVQVFSAWGLQDGDQVCGLLPDGRPWTEPMSVSELTGSAQSVMSYWAQCFNSNQAFSNRACYDDATPYLALSVPEKGWTMTQLEDRCVGGALNNVHGLAVHATGGGPRPPFLMAAFGCVNTWNGNGASAHFGISSDGTVLQFIPTSFIANAQSNPGNYHWISVELDLPKETAMSINQLVALESLFDWVRNRFAVPKKLATGCLFPSTPTFDQTTKDVCAKAGVPTTTDLFAAVMSRGLSCHWWLDPGKTGRFVHGCPGSAVMKQLVDVVM